MQPSAGYWQTFVEYAELSDVGLRRANNQDSLSVMLAGNELDFYRRGHLFLVADGMGRHAAGELASKISADTIPLEYFKQPSAAPPPALKFALEEGNRRIFARGQQNPDFKGMGTTTSVLVLLPQGAMVGHVGDSRVYRLRGNRLEQLSFDHSVVWEMQAVARSTGADLPTHIPKNFITRSLGHDATVAVDLEGPFPLAGGDTFLLCSDGLTGPVEDEELGVILGCLKPAEAVRTLVDLANLRGGPDNITVIVARVGDVAPLQSAPPPKAPRAGFSEVSPWLWVAMGVLTVLAGLMVMAGQPAVSIGAGLGALFVAVFVLAQAMGRAIRSSWAKHRLGRGPHTTRVCQISEPFLDRFVELIGKLRETALQQNWSIDWTRCDELSHQAVDRRRAGDFPESVRRYCQALSALMNEIRKQRQTTHRRETIEDEV